MEKELLDTFEAAKKAADAASAGGGPSEEDRCVDALRRLRRIPVTTNDLVSTQVGKRLRYLAKHPRAKIQAVASDLLEFWKNVVIEETSKGGKKNGTTEDKETLEVKSGRSETIVAKNISRSGSVKIEKHSRSENIKVEKMELDQEMKSEKVSTSVSAKVKVENKFSKSESVKTEKGGKGEAIKIERNPKEEKQTSGTKKPSPVPVGPPKLTSMVKCNDPIRDKLRELLSEAFSRVSSETSNDDREEVRNFLEEVDACDPIRVAVMVESVMFEKLGRSNGAQKVKYRSIMFNLKDGKNTDLRRRVLLGHVKPENLINMMPEEMASDERKQANKQIQEKALFECERAGAPKATTDQFKCGRCGQRKTTYYQLQTRSADEPMTTFVTCVNCNNHWKFC